MTAAPCLAGASCCSTARERERERVIAASRVDTHHDHGANDQTGLVDHLHDSFLRTQAMQHLQEHASMVHAEQRDRRGELAEHTLQY